MASTVIHLAIAKEIDKVLNIKNKKDYYLGSIAPDISKHIGETKVKSHFLYSTKDDIPNIDLFIKKYPNFKDNEFNLGYFIHLYTDKLWFDEFLDKLIEGPSIKLLDGTIIQSSEEEIMQLVYQDYTNLNIQLIEDYNLDLSLFYDEFQIPNTNLDDIPIDKLNLLIDAMGIIIENSKQEKTYTFDIHTVKPFINDSAKEILEILKQY